ncbi:MAG: MGH1-like glycoside hydrolase domain-containing protein, partial [Myxococcaceae bacterium]
SMVGLLPLAAVAIFDENILDRLPTFTRTARAFLMRHPELSANIHMPAQPGLGGRRMISIVNEAKLRRILSRMLDEREFLGPHGIRALSRHHLEHPYVFHLGNQEFRVGYVPGDSDSGMFGGNSNWRGPVWMPVNLLLWASLLRLAAYYGDGFKVECPTGSGKEMNLFQVAHELAGRLIGTFTRDASGRRPVFGGSERFQTDPHWRDCILFYEYFHGDNGAGIGASHQTGWTGAIARVIQLDGILTEEFLYAPDVEQRIFAAVRD